MNGQAVTSTTSITLRLSAMLTTVIALAVGATIYAAHQYGRAAATEAFDQLLTGAALQISERIFVVDGMPQVDVPVSAFELLSLGGAERVFYRIASPSGETLTGYDDFPLPPGGANGLEPIAYDATFRGADVRALMLPRRLAERQIRGDVSIVVGQTMESRDALAERITTRAAAVIGAAGLAVLILALVAMRFALRPLDRVQQAILERDTKDLSPFQIGVPAEVTALVTAINRFMGRLDRRVQTMQNFVADAAHQIRTPIAALRAQADLAIDETDPERLRTLHRRIRARAIGLSRLTDQLLSQALVTHRADTERLTPIDLRRVAIDAEREIRLIGSHDADAIGLDLSEDPVMVAGDGFSLREAVKNLLNNSLAHGKPPILLSVYAKNIGREGAHGLIRVRDHGTGLPRDMAGAIGQRFRANPDKPESAGLGLAIVREVALNHRGRVVVERDAGSFAIGLTLPLEYTGQTREASR